MKTPQPTSVYTPQLVRHSSAPSRRLLSAMLTIVAAAVVFNVAWEMGAPASTVPIRIAASSDLIDLARAEHPSLPVKVGFALSLRTVAAGGVLVVPDITRVEARQIEFLSDMTIRIEEYVAQLDQDDLDVLLSFESIEGTGKIHWRDQNPSAYVIAWLPGREPVETMRVYSTSSGTMVVVDERIVIEMNL